MEHIATNIRFLRIASGLTAPELAKKLKLPRHKTIFDWELHKQIPKINQLIEISNLFKVSLDTLCTKEITYNTKFKMKL